jgi:hypothetical protein
MTDTHAAPNGRGGEPPRQARARRRWRMRRNVAAASLATFALTWGVIAGTGSMGASTSTSAAGSSSAAGGSSAQSQSRQSPSQQQLPDLTTRQS